MTRLLSVLLLGVLTLYAIDRFGAVGWLLVVPCIFVIFMISDKKKHR